MRLLRFDLLGMTVLIPSLFRKARNASVSYPLSARSSAMPGIRLTQVSATTRSAVLPGVRTKTQGRHFASTTACILLFRPPFVTPIACVSAPLFRRWHSDGFLCDCCRAPPVQVCPARRRPTPTTFARCPFHSTARSGCKSSCGAHTQADPATTASLHVHDPAQYSPIIFPRRTRLVARQLRFNLRPLFVAEPKQARVHGWPRNPLANTLTQHMVN
jgi:hypothetical protein